MKRILCSILSFALLLGLVGCANTEKDWQEQYDLGMRYLEDGDYEEAILAFSAAIKIDGSRPEAYVGRADAYVATGETDKALKDYKKAKKIAERSEEDYEDLIDDLDEIIEAIEESTDTTENPVSGTEESTEETTPEVVNPAYNQAALEAYRDILDMYYESISCNWSNCDNDGWNVVGDPNNACYLFYHYESDLTLEEIGFALIDINGDGQAELIVSPMRCGDSGYIYDMYTISDGQIIHVISTGERSIDSLAVDGTINNHGSGSAFSGVNGNYRLENGELVINNKLYYCHPRENGDPMIYAKYDAEGVQQEISYEEYSAILDSFPENAPISLTPFSEYPGMGSTAGALSYDIVREDRSQYRDNGTLAFEHYYDCVVLQGNSQTVEKINAAIREDMDGFLYTMDEESLHIYTDPLPDSSYVFATATGEVTDNSGKVFSICLWERWFMGGVVTANCHSLNFDARTGEPVNLPVLYAMEEEDFLSLLKETCWAYLSENYATDLWSEAQDVVFGYDLDDFYYYFQNGELIVVFPPYSISYGAKGCIQVPTGLCY